jgi:thiol:disulfide interchange protein DsbC
MPTFVSRLVATLFACAMVSSTLANETVIRTTLAKRLPDMPPIDEISKTGIPGLFEVRVGTDIFYSDAKGNYIIQGSIVDARTRRNLTEARLSKITAIEFAKLPLDDAIVWKNGTGERRVAVFSDPNCGYCKRLEVDLQKLKNITVYTFLVPVLGPDSEEKSRNVWCASDKAKVWLSWMLEGKPPAPAAADCKTPLERNTALARKHRVNGTPAIVFTDNTRVPGAMAADEIEKRLVAAAAAGKAK